MMIDRTLQTGQQSKPATIPYTCPDRTHLSRSAAARLTRRHTAKRRRLCVSAAAKKPQRSKDTPSKSNGGELGDLGERILSGEFTDEGSTKERLTRPLRKILAKDPIGPGTVRIRDLACVVSTCCNADHFALHCAPRRYPRAKQEPLKRSVLERSKRICEKVLESKNAGCSCDKQTRIRHLFLRLCGRL